MFDSILGPFIIALMRICDVSIGTFRTILVVQGRKYPAAIAGFVEVLIWVFAIRFIFQQLDNIYNLFGYAVGFALGNILGISLEQRIGLGHIQMNIISRTRSLEIAEALRSAKHGVTILPGEGGMGEVSIVMCIIARKERPAVMRIIESIDSDAFITTTSSVPYRGFIHGSRK